MEMRPAVDQQSTLTREDRLKLAWAQAKVFALGVNEFRRNLSLAEFDGLVRVLRIRQDTLTNEFLRKVPDSLTDFMK